MSETRADVSETTPGISGIHHVTAITADAQKNLNFYAGVLGLRLVKVTVNFDDPTSYHLYYGNEAGEPGTIMTFFVWPGASRGRVGPPQVTETAFAVPARRLAYWRSRFEELRIPYERFTNRLGEEGVSAADPDGLHIEIVATGSISDHGPGIQGFHSATITEEGYETTAKLLTDVMGFRFMSSETNRFRYEGARDTPASVVDLICVPSARRGVLGAGTVHHIAFRTPTASEQALWREALVASGYNVTPVIDRKYFQSIYFREPGGVLFEIATIPPGFTVDEPLASLGSSLMLPPALESRRGILEQLLPPLNLSKRLI